MHIVFVMFSKNLDCHQLSLHPVGFNTSGQIMMHHNPSDHL